MSFYMDENGNIGVKPERIDTPEYVYVKYPKKRILKKQLEEAERSGGSPADVLTGNNNNQSGDFLRDFYGF